MSEERERFEAALEQLGVPKAVCPSVVDVVGQVANLLRDREERLAWDLYAAANGVAIADEMLASRRRRFRGST